MSKWTASLSIVVAIFGVAACSNDDNTKETSNSAGASGKLGVGGSTGIAGRAAAGGSSAGQGGIATGGKTSEVVTAGSAGVSTTMAGASGTATTTTVAGAAGTTSQSTGGTTGFAGTGNLAGWVGSIAGNTAGGNTGGTVAGSAGRSATGGVGTSNAGALNTAGAVNAGGNAAAGNAGAAGAPPVAWLDPATGLTWQVETQQLVTFAGAATYCAGLTLDGRDDWRVPTIDELRTIISGCAATLPTGTCGLTNSCLSAITCRDDSCGGCVAIPDSCYVKAQLGGACGYVWSSSIQSDYTDNAWGVGFNGGHVSADLKLNDGYARCVRP